MLGRDSSVGIVTRLRSGQFDARQGKALGPSQHVVPGHHPEAVMRPGHEVDHSPDDVPKLRMNGVTHLPPYASFAFTQVSVHLSGLYP